MRPSSFVGILFVKPFHLIVLLLTLTAGNTNSADDQSSGKLTELHSFLSAGSNQPKFLHVDEAFALNVESSGANQIKAVFTIADGYYLYREKIKLSGNGGARLAEYKLPAGQLKTDQYFGEMAVFEESFPLTISLQRLGPKASELYVNARYQGCAEDGICYPPVNKTYRLTLPALTVADSPVDRGRTPLLSLLFGAFLAGILLAGTPCVLPLIPILTSIIAGQGNNLTRLRGGNLAIQYVLGTSVTYACMGALAGATGEQLQAYFQNAWAIGFLSALLFVMALSLFGLFEIQMPSSIQSRLQNKTSRLGGSASWVFLLGLLSALIVGACVSPILISFLGFAIAQGDPYLGAQMMFAMALGMGVPLIALGFGASYLIPRAGVWMERIRQLLGVSLIGVAIYLLGALPQVPVLLLWGIYLMTLGSYLSIAWAVGSKGFNGRWLSAGLGGAVIVWGIVVLIGGLLGQRDLSNPIPKGLFIPSDGAHWTMGETPPTSHLLTRVKNLDELDKQFRKASDEQKFIMLEYYANWCADCVRMERSTFSDPRVLELISQHFVSLQVDVTDPSDPDQRELKKRFDVFGPPAVLFFDSRGSPLTARHFYGYRDPDTFLALLDDLIRERVEPRLLQDATVNRHRWRAPQRPIADGTRNSDRQSASFVSNVSYLVR